MLTALVVDDDSAFHLSVGDFLADHGFTVDIAEDAASARRRLATGTPDLLVIDLVLPDGSGLDVIDTLPADATTHVLIVTGHPSVETAIGAVRKRVDDYLVKPVSLVDLKNILARVTQDTMPPHRGSTSPGSTTQTTSRLLLGGSAIMQELVDQIERVAPTAASVLIQGESGTGKELIANELHRLSGRQGRLIAVNCGAIAEALITSTLFGHEKGAFTGADKRHPGIFERAHGGTVFLDEITEMPAELQVGLLRVLETGRVTRVGGDKEIEVDARVVAATNRQAEQAVRDGHLREDLYYRLMVYPIQVPPLRARPDDIIPLAESFLTEQNQALGTHKILTEAAARRLRAHTWPGNVRELKHTIQRMVINAHGDLDESSVPEAFDTPPLWDSNSLELSVGTPIADAERRLVLATLKHFKGDKKLAAETLGVSLKTIYNRLNSYADAGLWHDDDDGHDSGLRQRASEK